MYTAELLNQFSSMMDELNSQGKSARWLAARRCLVVLLKSYKIQLEYETAKTKSGIVIDFMEGNTPLNKEDRKNIKEAASLNWKIGKRLAEIKKGK